MGKFGVGHFQPLPDSYRKWLLSEAKSDSQEIKNACKLAKRCYEKLKKGDFEDGLALKKFRTTGGGRKSRAPEVREVLFQ